MNRSKLSAEDRAFLEAEVDPRTGQPRHLQVSSYLDNVYDAIVSGNPSSAKVNVPNYNTNQNVFGSLNHETGGLSMDMEGLFASSAEALGEQGMLKAAEGAFNARADGKATFANPGQQAGQVPQMPKAGARVSENQFRAIKKYPQIVEFLGTEQGAKIANRVVAEINSLIAEQIEKNSQLVHDNARACVAQKQYLHQFFQGDGWVCKVTASGPFRGNEAFFFKEDEDKSFILRRHGGRYEDVSAEFNIIHDLRVAEGEQDED